MTGLGVSHQNIRQVYGVFKAYMTRVGNGPFVTEDKGKIGKKLREIGGEFGATTGRPRRCGWLDIPALRYACMINGVTQLFMTKADVLNDFDEVKVCLGYSFIDADDNEEYSVYSYDNKIYSKDAKPIYRKFSGWNTIDNKEPLEEFIQYIESEIGVPITLVSTGKDRDDVYERF
jgi:adenylosuccinate synthase